MTLTTTDEMVLFLTEWASRWRCALQLRGEVGDNECVGIRGPDSWVDYGGLPTPIWTPADSYPQHPWLVVLGHGEQAIKDLYVWVRYLDVSEYEVRTVPRMPRGFLDALTAGFSVTHLVRRGHPQPQVEPEPVPEEHTCGCCTTLDYLEVQLRSLREEFAEDPAAHEPELAVVHDLLDALGK